MREFQLLIFDWDGTLVDSVQRIVDSMWFAATECGLPLRSATEVRGIIGLGLPEAIQMLYPDVQDAPTLAQFRSAYSEHYLYLEREPSPLFAGVREALASFREQGYQLAVATGKSRRGLERVLDGQGLRAFFDVTRCADETASKPNPLMLEEILAHCSASPAQSLMVGDSPFDVLMAHNAGVMPVAVSYGAQPLSVLQACQPQLCIDHFSELQDWLATRRR